MKEVYVTEGYTHMYLLKCSHLSALECLNKLALEQFDKSSETFQSTLIQVDYCLLKNCQTAQAGSGMRAEVKSQECEVMKDFCEMMK